MGLLTDTAPIAEEKKSTGSHSDYQKRVRERTRKDGKTVLAFIKTLQNVPKDVMEAAEWLGREPSAGGSGSFGTPVINRLFGDELKVGATIKAEEVYHRTGKGYAEMRQLMRKWAEKGVTVELDKATDTYKLTKL